MNSEIIIALLASISIMGVGSWLLFHLKDKKVLITGRIKSCDVLLETLESLSYCLSLKLWNIDDIMAEVKKAFFHQDFFPVFMLILTDSKKPPETQTRLFCADEDFEHSFSPEQKKKVLDKIKLMSPRKGELHTHVFEENTVPWKMAFIGTLAHLTQNYGTIVFFGNKQKNLEPEVSDFLLGVAGIVSFLIKRAYFDARVPVSEQLQAVNVPW